MAPQHGQDWTHGPLLKMVSLAIIWAHQVDHTKEAMCYREVTHNSGEILSSLQILLRLIISVGLIYLRGLDLISSSASYWTQILDCSTETCWAVLTLAAGR